MASVKINDAFRNFFNHYVSSREGRGPLLSAGWLPTTQPDRLDANDRFRQPGAAGDSLPPAPPSTPTNSPRSRSLSSFLATTLLWCNRSR